MLSPLFAFGIVNLATLGWLAAVAAPIVIHLWSRRKYRETPWAAMEYLLAAAKRQTRRLLFERWLLLLLRTLLIVFVVLAIAEPYTARPGTAIGPQQHTHRVLVFDGSYSMAYRPTDKSRFDRAKELARQIVADSPQGDAFTLVLMSSPPQVIVAAPTLERSEIRREIDNLRLPHMMADLPATIAAVYHLIETLPHDSPRLSQHEICFLTDMQRVTWAPKLPPAAAAAFLKQTEDLVALAALRLIDVGQPAAENMAITKLRPVDPLMIVGRPVELQVELKNFGTEARARQPVELLIDGRRVEQKEIDVPPQAAASLAFSYRFDSTGDHAVEVRAGGDALDIDNHRFLAVRLRKSIRALCIDGRPSGEPFHGAADYLAAALSSPGGSDRGLIDSEVAAENALMNRDLRPYDCVLLCNVAQFTVGEARTLDAYLHGGGSLIIFLGDQVVPDRYNRELGVAGQGSAARPHILPAKIGAVVDAPRAPLDPLDYRHPVLQAFRGRGEAALLMTPIFKYYKFTLPENSLAKTMLGMTGGDPLMVEEPIGRGRVVLVATSAEPRSSWTAMPLWPSFVPLMQETVVWCVGRGLQSSNLLAGEPIDVSGGLQTVAAPLSVQTPDGRTRSAPSRTASERSSPKYRDTTQSGIYVARFVGSDSSRRLGQPPGGYSETFAVNVDTTESDLAQITPEELQTDVWPGIPVVHQTSWQEPGDSAGAKPSQTGSRLHVGLLYAALGLLFAETFLAWKMGRQ